LVRDQAKAPPVTLLGRGIDRKYGTLFYLTKRGKASRKPFLERHRLPRRWRMHAKTGSVTDQVERRWATKAHKVNEKVVETEEP